MKQFCSLFGFIFLTTELLQYTSLNLRKSLIENIEAETLNNFNCSLKLVSDFKILHHGNTKIKDINIIEGQLDSMSCEGVAHVHRKFRL